MNIDALKGLENISQAVGEGPDFVQGGGGNTSVKLDDNHMAVKASGYRLDQVTEDEGYVIVDYQRIREYFNTIDTTRDVNYELESSSFMKDSVLKDKNPKDLRPSIETGFHSFMGTYVIHSHSVYGNLLSCSKEGKDHASKIFANKYNMLWISYSNPGFDLTLYLNEAVGAFESKKGRKPNVIFMENHGLIVSAEEAEDCIELHENVNKAIIDYFKIDDPYPEVSISKEGEGVYKSESSYLIKTLRERRLGPELFKDVILYPDQLVYLGDNISYNGGGKVNVNLANNEILYAANESEALTIEETFVAYIYVIDKILELGLTIQTMSEDAILFIRNMEGEKYRKALLKK